MEGRFSQPYKPAGPEAAFRRAEAGTAPHIGWRSFAGLVWQLWRANRAGAPSFILEVRLPLPWWPPNA